MRITDPGWNVREFGQSVRRISQRNPLRLRKLSSTRSQDEGMVEMDQLWAFVHVIPTVLSCGSQGTP